CGACDNSLSGHWMF
nr:immunoglobulin light chain junction region [Macaca mulatta]